jgi:hypothetical protein
MPCLRLWLNIALSVKQDVLHSQALDIWECEVYQWICLEIRTSQGTHYVSTTESSQLMLCKI